MTWHATYCDRDSFNECRVAFVDVLKQNMRKSRQNIDHACSAVLRITKEKFITGEV